MKAVLITLAGFLLLVCARADTSCGDQSPDIPVIATGHGEGLTQVEALAQAWAEILLKLQQAADLLGMGCEDMTCWNEITYYSCDEGSHLSAVVDIFFHQDPITQKYTATVHVRGTYSIRCSPCSGLGPVQLPQ